METISRKVDELVVGNRVALESCPFLNAHPSAKFGYAVVTHVERETPNCVIIGYEGIDHVGYKAGTVIQVRAPRDVTDPVVKVHPVDRHDEWSDWQINQNLTDRWGDINDHAAETKPLDLLTSDEAQLTRLRAQMWDEITFIVRKDGKFGILFEVECCSKESEAGHETPGDEFYAGLKPHAEVVTALLDGMKPLAEQFPGVQFAVPEEKQIINDRPAAWAFVPEGLLSDEQRQALGMALLNL